MVDKQQIWDKLAGHFADPDSEKGNQELEEWLKNASLEERELFEATKDLWEITSLDPQSFSPDVEKGWQRLQLKIKMREREKKHIPYFQIAAAVLLLMVFSFLIFRNLQQPERIELVAANDVKFITLPDGSEVWLNTNSSLSYSEAFNSNNREVFLSGEAFFNVKKAEGKRFAVLTDETITEVIGTSFTITARENEPVFVQVTSGKVAFADRDKKEAVFLAPGEKAEFYKQHKDSIAKKPIDDINYRYWQNKKLVFQNTSLSSLAKTLEDKFNTTIFISEGLENCRFTGSFNKPKLEEVLNVLQITGDFQIQKTPEGYSISGKGCN